MSAKVGIPMGIFKIRAKKNSTGLLENPMGKYSYRMEGKKSMGKLSKLRCYSFCKEIILF